MVRVKRGKSAHKRRKKILKYTKGFRWGRKSKFRRAKEAILHAFKYSYRDRKTRKREFRKLWQIQINSASRQLGLPYNRLIYGLKKEKIQIDRKNLAELAKNHPEIFKKIVERAKKD